MMPGAWRAIPLPLPEELSGATGLAQVQPRIELRQATLLGQVLGAVMLQVGALQAQYQLRGAAIPSHAHGQLRRQQCCHLRRRLEIHRAAMDVGASCQRDLDQIEVLQALGIDIDVGAVFQAIERQSPAADVVQAGADHLAALHRFQLMGLEHLADALTARIPVVHEKLQAARTEQPGLAKALSAFGGRDVLGHCYLLAHRRGPAHPFVSCRLQPADSGCSQRIVGGQRNSFLADRGRPCRGICKGRAKQGV